MSDGNDRPKTYEDLLREAQEDWSRKQAQMAAEIRALHAQFSAMPDVRDAPAPTSLRNFSADGVRCQCGDEVFVTLRWNTINGVRHRMEVQCAGCRTIQTWDWTMKAWVA